MAEICLRNNLTICSDEIHCDLVYSGHKHIPIATLDPEIAFNTITLIAPSKTFNIAGLKSSIAIIQNSDLRGKFEAASKGLVGSVNLLGQVATLAAYKEGASWLDDLLIYLEKNRNFLVDYIDNHIPGIATIQPEGTYLAWLDCRSADIHGTPGEFFLEKAHVGVNDGAWFGKGGGGFVRMNFGCPRSMLEKALEQMREALESK
jgi:cystathionine beta-lyase